jgi:aspartyl-tRNA synthetase
VSAELFEQAGRLGAESVLTITGLVRDRPSEMFNPEMTTGEVRAANGCARPRAVPIE